MNIQKVVTYNSISTDGQILDNKYKLELNILKKSGNYVLHKDILRHQTNLRQGTSSTKTRSEVRGGGRKPWAQKGTGRARAGSNTSPLWKGGGVVFGPKPKTVVLKLNKKERRLALQTLLYNKRNIISVIDNLEYIIDKPKTKIFLEICENCDVNLDQKILIIVSKKTPPLKLSVQNLKNVEIISTSNLNTFSLLKAKQILLTTLSISEIQEIFCDH